MRRHTGGALLKAAEWFSLHTGKHVVVLSERLAQQLGGGGGGRGSGGNGAGLSKAMGALAISPATCTAATECAAPRGPGFRVYN